MVHAFYSPLKESTHVPSLPGHLSPLCLSLLRRLCSHELRCTCPTDCTVSPLCAGSLGRLVSCSSIISPLILLEQQELPRTRPGSAHREALINLGKLDRPCIVPRPLRKTDVWEGTPGSWEGSWGTPWPGTELWASSWCKKRTRKAATSYGGPTALLQNYHLTPPPMEAFGSSVSTSRTNPRYWLYKLCSMLQSRQTAILVTAADSCRLGHQHHSTKVIPHLVCLWIPKTTQPHQLTTYSMDNFWEITPFFPPHAFHVNYL